MPTMIYAKTMLCPMQSTTSEQNCVGDHCMAWRWHLKNTVQVTP